MEDLCIKCERIYTECICGELTAIQEAELEADKENQEEFVEAGLPYVKLSQKLPVYNLKV